MVQALIKFKRTKALVRLFSIERTASKKQTNHWKAKFAYKDINFKEKILSHLIDKSNKTFQGFKFILEKELRILFL